MISLLFIYYIVTVNCTLTGSTEEKIVRNINKSKNNENKTKTKPIKNLLKPKTTTYFDYSSDVYDWASNQKILPGFKEYNTDSLKSIYAEYPKDSLGSKKIKMNKKQEKKSSTDFYQNPDRRTRPVNDILRTTTLNPINGQTITVVKYTTTSVPLRKIANILEKNDTRIIDPITENTSNQIKSTGESNLSKGISSIVNPDCKTDLDALKNTNLKNNEINTNLVNLNAPKSKNNQNEMNDKGGYCSSNSNSNCIPLKANPSLSKNQYQSNVPDSYCHDNSVEGYNNLNLQCEHTKGLINNLQNKIATNTINNLFNPNDPNKIQCKDEMSNQKPLNYYYYQNDYWKKYNEYLAYINKMQTGGNQPGILSQPSTYLHPNTKQHLNNQQLCNSQQLSNGQQLSNSQQMNNNQQSSSTQPNTNLQPNTFLPPPSCLSSYSLTEQHKLNCIFALSNVLNQINARIQISQNQLKQNELLLEQNSKNNIEVIIGTSEVNDSGVYSGRHRFKIPIPDSSSSEWYDDKSEKKINYAYVKVPKRRKSSAKLFKRSPKTTCFENGLEFV